VVSISKRFWKFKGALILYLLEINQPKRAGIGSHSSFVLPYG
jgi:hypothetical protein